MSAEQLLNELVQRGVVLTADGETLIFKAPRGVLTDDLRQQIVACKPELLPILRQCKAGSTAPVDNPADLTLAQFARSGKVLRVRSRLLGEDVWWVSDGNLKRAVADPTLVVYTAGELRHLVNISPRDLINLHRIKKTFHGNIEN